ncbi:Exo_endo_phos domain-containing protein [Cephalotus follicularis]|uniref:Exo_endo_phos domain-containing protein n=1 Tax=Cephalotus follicularis TaxID=3775 RepID=A0A1Q3BIJ9_CEPFO|nr:Exo_endo_phos domain-containing protein [Cephalotus follicularis]
MINFLIWNLRGTGPTTKLDYIKHEVKSSNISFCALLEPKHEGSHLLRTSLALHILNYIHCNPINTHIWLLWNNDIDVQIVDTSDQFITTKITHKSKSFFLSTVYASCEISWRQLLWHDLSYFNPGSLPWLIGGDFNTISTPSEKCGGGPYSNTSMDHFNRIIANASLLEVSFLGDQYTWCNDNAGPKMIWLRLDRLLTNLARSLAFPNLKLIHKPRILSDHCPLVAIFQEPSRLSRSIKFCRQWTQDEDFSDLISRLWVPDTEGPPLVKLHKKLMRCKSAFSSRQKQKKKMLFITKSWKLLFKSSTLRSSSNRCSIRTPFVSSTMLNNFYLLW